MIGTVDKGHFGLLTLLDPSAAFDMVDHTILKEALRRRFAIGGKALGWLAEYLSSRSQVVHVAGSETDAMVLQFGVPQGSVLGPRIFIEYAEDVSDVFVRHAMRHHLFADDMQGQCSGPPHKVSMMTSQVERCITDISYWCACKRLQLFRFHLTSPSALSAATRNQDHYHQPEHHQTGNSCS